MKFIWRDYPALRLQNPRFSSSRPIDKFNTYLISRDLSIDQPTFFILLEH